MTVILTHLFKLLSFFPLIFAVFTRLSLSYITLFPPAFSVTYPVPPDYHYRRTDGQTDGNVISIAERFSLQRNDLRNR